VIELERVSCGYDGGELLADITLRLAPGSFHFLTGPSGAGKTTLLKLINAQILANSGTVRLFGRDICHLDRDEIARARRRIGFVHQDCEFLDHLSIAENIALPLSAAGRDVAAAADNLRELTAWVGLSARKNALPPELSGGERQRAAVARAVIMDPELILADEPTGNLDWEMSLRLLTLFVELNRSGKAILVATHDLNLIRAAKARIAARVLRIKDRRLHLAEMDL